MLVPYDDKFARISTRSTKGELSGTNLHKTIVLPRPVFIDKASNIITKPLCWTNRLPHKYSVDDVKNNLDVFVTQTKRFHLRNLKIGGKSDKACYLDVQSARMTFAITVPEGDSSPGTNTMSLESIKMRSVAVGIWKCPGCGAADIWLDNDHGNRTLVDMKFYYRQTSTATIAFHVKPGNHTVNVEIVREGDIPIVALIIGPADGPY